MSFENPSNNAKEQSPVEQEIVLLKQEYEWRTRLASDFTKKKRENLQRRLSSEISGVELDRLDAEIDEALDYNQKEIETLREQIRGTIELRNLESARPDTAVQSEVLENADLEPGYFDGLTTEVASSPYIEDLKVVFSLRDVMGLIARHGDITAPDGYVYKKEDILNIVGNLHGSDDPNLQRVTNTYGLRDRIKAILVKSEIESRYKPS